MNAEIESLLRENFEFFVTKVFRDLHDGEKLDVHPYIEYLCSELEQVANANSRRLVINLPPRHLKTFLGSICLPAWILGHKPATKISRRHLRRAAGSAYLIPYPPGFAVALVPKNIQDAHRRRSRESE